MGLPHLIFLKAWTDDNITSKPRSKLGPVDPALLMQRCLDDAEGCGYALADLEEEVGGLQAFIENMLARKLSKAPKPKQRLNKGGSPRIADAR